MPLKGHTNDATDIVKNCKHSYFTMVGEVNLTIINVRIVALIQQLQYLDVKSMKLLQDNRLNII